MKKTLIILATAIGIILLGNVLIASAQGRGPGSGPNTDYMTRMHEAVWTALAGELGMTYDELTAAVQNGKTIWQIAEEKGVSIERLREVMLEARAAALADLAAEGAITQAQADWMLSHSQTMMGSGLGNCGGPGMMGGGGMMGGRGMMNGFGPMRPWAQPPAPSGSNG